MLPKDGIGVSAHADATAKKDRAAAAPPRKMPPPRVTVGDRVQVLKNGVEGVARYVGAITGLPSGKAAAACTPN